MTPPMSTNAIGSPPDIASPNSDSGQPLRSSLMELSSPKLFQPLYSKNLIFYTCMIFIIIFVTYNSIPCNFLGLTITRKEKKTIKH